MTTGALVVAACPRVGSPAFYRRLIARYPCVIAADGGIDVCLTAGRVPDICVGDFDSASARGLEKARTAGAEIVRVPAEKDRSDLEIALATAAERGHDDVTVTAAFAGRADHLLAAFGALLHAPCPRVRGVDPGLECHALDAALEASLELHLAPGTLLSLFAADPRTIVSASGVRYPLTAEPLEPWTAHGLSNVATAPRQSLTVHAGRLLVVIIAPDIPPEGTELHAKDR